MSSADLNAFLNANKKEKNSTSNITNARIGDKAKGIYGGSYSISDLDYPAFLNKYRKEIVETGKVEYLTEIQLPNDGPILVDLDFRFPYEMTERQYTKDHIDDVVGAYSEELIKMFQFDAHSTYQIFVLEKTAINRVEEKQITKDGLHLIIGVSAERKMQIALRAKMVGRLAEMWGDSLPITNTWEDVLDDGISLGHTGWQLYGSTKPGCEAYQLTHIYTVGYDPDDRQPTIDCRSKATSPDWSPKWEALLPQLSARCRSHPKFFYKSEFVKELDRVVVPRRISEAASTSAAAAQPQNTIPRQEVVLSAQNQQDLDAIIANFVEANEASGKWELTELLWYTMALPESYYGTGSYAKWIRVGMALKNSDPSSFLIWVAFSAQYSGFNFSDISTMLDKWSSFDLNRAELGITKRSIMYWCKSDAPKEYRAVQLKCADSAASRAMGGYEEIDEKAKTIDRKGTTDYDIASVLYSINRDDYKCVSITNNIWYKYEEPRWKKIDAGVDLRRVISGALRMLYVKKASQMMELRDSLSSDDDDPRKKEKITKYCDKLLSVCARLGSTNDKKNIMIEAKELFYDSEFLEKLDSNKKLFCFKNGVVDFEEKRFRRGTPEDYLTKCANIDYVTIDPVIHQPIIDEINDFMRKLFPDTQIHDYMWEHLAATLIGLLPNQTWNIYIGDGQNGKSMLIKAMEYVLGDYKGTMPINLLTDRRGKIGGAMPEIVQLKGLRMAVAQEPQKGDRINDGVVKQLTSGIDTIQGRGLYMAQSEEFYPQFELVLCTNYLMEIQSNDHGTWRRIRVVPFKSLFTDEPVDNDPEKPYQYKIDRSLEERLSSWKEVFASLLVDIAYKNMGKVADCEMVMAASNAYRQSQDSIAEFIGDRTVVDPSGSISKTELGVEFKNWFEATYGRRGGPNIKEVQAYMDKKFKKCATRKVWMGIRINYDQDMRSIMDNDIPETSLSDL
jgi:P4 family phage/plasmid primase-like protien